MPSSGPHPLAHRSTPKSISQKLTMTTTNTTQEVVKFVFRVHILYH
jgi:hypothetical protein